MHWTPVFAGALGAFSAVSTVGQDFQLSRITVDGGGVVSSTGGDFELSGTVGQPDAGVLSGGVFELYGGFWFPLALDDCNSDGVVNLYDYDDFDGCVSGPCAGLSFPQCSCFDLDGDYDVDLVDVGRFQAEFTGGL
jgi:hypothetical protein